MEARLSGRLAYGPVTIPESRMITARSHLIDRFFPACEVILLPPKTENGGTLEFLRQDHLATAPISRKQKLNPLRKGAGTQVLTDTVFVDFRLRNPHNWAHFLNNHLPIAFALLNQTQLSPADVTLVLPGNIPAYIVDVAGFFGFRTLATTDTVKGEAITFTSEPWTGIRAIRADWARLPMVRAILNDHGVHNAPSGDMPEKIFLSRRDTRTLENEKAVEASLENRGYAKIYPEDLSVADQLHLFEQAKSIVAIHGAGLAPLLYLSEASRLEHVIELFPCGHMTDVYRVMCHQVGCKWVGVRGKIKPEHVAPAYDLETPFLKYSLQSFEVDIASLDLAFEMI